MGPITQTFATAKPPTLSIEARSGSVTIDTDETDETVVEVAFRSGDRAAEDLATATVVEQSGDTIVVRVPKRGSGFLGRQPRVDIQVTAPHGSRLAVGTHSADVIARGRYGDGRVNTGSGNVQVAMLSGAGRLKTGSGNVTLEAAEADVDIKTGSGDITVGWATGAVSASAGSGDVTVDNGKQAIHAGTGSGNITVGEAEGDVESKTGSGNVRIRQVQRGRTRARAASGNIHVGVRDGTAAWLDVSTVSGTVRSELESAGEPGPADERVELGLTTVSGNVTIVRA